MLAVCVGTSSRSSNTNTNTNSNTDRITAVQNLMNQIGLKFFVDGILNPTTFLFSKNVENRQLKLKTKTKCVSRP